MDLHKRLWVQLFIVMVLISIGILFQNPVLIRMGLLLPFFYIAFAFLFVLMRWAIESYSGLAWFDRVKIILLGLFGFAITLAFIWYSYIVMCFFIPK